MLTVLEKAENQDLVALALVKGAFDVSDNKQDEKLKRLISQSSGMIASYCNRVFLKETISETFRSHSNHRGGIYAHHHGHHQSVFLLLKRRPIASVTSLIECDVALDPSEYAVDYLQGSLERLCDDRSAHWRGTCVVTYVGGYELADVPPDLQGATFDLISYLQQRSNRDQTVQSLEIPGVINTRYQLAGSSGIPDYIATVLDEYAEPNEV